MYADNVALPAFARRTPRCCAPCKVSSCCGPCSESETDEQTDGLGEGRTPVMQRPCYAYMRAVPIKPLDDDDDDDDDDDISLLVKTTNDKSKC